ncbi:MAG: hypothetical protein HUK20_12350 [Fibrobacter sp.]|nr:hypothetical protein [Fibrobacter sp.]
MKKLAVALLAFATFTLVACGPSKLEMQEMSSQCDVMVEVRQVLNDSISLFVGNTLYLNAKQTISDSFYPLLVSTRDPSELEKPTATDILNSDEELLNYLRRVSPDMMQVGLVIGETAANEIGFNESETIKKMIDVFKKVNGGSMVLFHEKSGELTSMKKLY